MSRDLVSKQTRNEFREVLVGFTLREIDTIFDGVGLQPDAAFEPPVSGQRRSLVEQYYATIDFANPQHVKRLIAAYEEIMLWLERGGVTEAIVRLRQRMERDGFRYEGGRFVASGLSAVPLVDAVHAHARALDLMGLQTQIHRLVAAAETDPALAVGTAKELVETVCKTILEERGHPPAHDDMPKLVKAVAKELALLPDGVPDATKGADTIRRVLSNLGQVTQGLAELRNLYGTGHGASARVRGVQPRHARLAAGAAATLAMFLVETHLDRSAKGEIEREGTKA